jgi:hypothetical protein
MATCKRRKVRYGGIIDREAKNRESRRPGDVMKICSSSVMMNVVYVTD